MATDSDHTFDVIVIGLGPGGEHVAGSLAERGLRVLGVDRRLVGGECPYWGCIPSKMMIRAADALAEARRVDGLAGSVGEVTPDWSVVAKRIREEATDNWDDRVAVDRLTGKGATFVRGTGRIAGPGRVDVDGTAYTATKGIVVNTGTTACGAARSRACATRPTGPTTRSSRPRSCPPRSSCSAAAPSAAS